jgi:hypothetical protein
MKWYKQETSAHNDEKIRELIHEFGCEGYGVYIIILELVGEKIDDNLSPLISISDRVLREKCRVSHQKLTKILSFFDQKVMVFSNLNGKYWDISCPNMLNRLDNWTKRSQVATKLRPTQPEPEVELEEEEEKEPGLGSLKKKLSTKLGHSVDSEANQQAVKEIIESVSKDKAVKSVLAVAHYRANNL